MLTLESLRQHRKQLLHAIEAMKTPTSFLQIQEKVIQSIRQLEKHRGSGSDAVDFRPADQIRKFRMIVDGLAWCVLHPHVIRQHAKGPGSPPDISSQGSAFDTVISSAKQWTAENDVPVLICDAANILRLGDVLVCIDPEAPTVVECKKKLPLPQHLTQGRRGRQLSRVLGTNRYLTQGQSRVFGDPTTYIEVSSNHRAARNWKAVDELCTQCYDRGMVQRKLSDHEILWVFRPSVVGDRPSLSDFTIQSNAYFGTSEGLMNMDDGLFAPPSIWPIDVEHRAAILEGEIVVAHCVCASAFEACARQDMPIQVKHKDDTPLRVHYKGKVYPISLRFIYDVLYGYETVESCVDGISNFAIQIARIETGSLSPESESKPAIRHVRNAEEAVALLSICPSPEYISIPVALLAKLANELDCDGAALIVAESSAYCIVEWAPFAETLRGRLKGRDV